MKPNVGFIIMGERGWGGHLLVSLSSQAKCPPAADSPPLPSLPPKRIFEGGEGRRTQRGFIHASPIPRMNSLQMAFLNAEIRLLSFPII